MIIIIDKPFILSDIFYLLNIKFVPATSVWIYKENIFIKRIHRSIFYSDNDDFIWYMNELEYLYNDFSICFVYDTLCNEIVVYSNRKKWKIRKNLNK